MVLHKFGEKLYTGLEGTITAHLKTVAVEIGRTQGDEFMKQLNIRWLDHSKSMQMIRDILMYMDRTYVQQNNKTPVYELGLYLWRQEVVRLPRIKERLQTMLLGTIHKERSGEVVDRSLLRSITQMLMDLGRPIYQEDFEAPFLNAARAFYKVESIEFLGTSDCPDFLLKAEKRLKEEIDRVHSYLDASTEAKITTVVEQEVLGEHMQTLLEMENSGIVKLLTDDKYNDLSRMYLLFRRVDSGLRMMRDMMQHHVKATGKELVTDAERQRDPVDFVQKLLDLKDKFTAIIAKSFVNDKAFQHTLNQSFEYFINLNTRSPEYLQEKDVFEKYYKGHLAKRLLSGRTISEDAERSLILKLKIECGYQFTAKLEGMFTDMKTSRDTMMQYRQILEKKNIRQPCDINVQVLTTGSWPTASCRCNLPRVLLQCCQSFEQFYLTTHSGRKLVWQTNMGSADLKATFLTGKHELNVSTYQLCILLLFNESDSLSYKDIQGATDIPTSDLKRSLQSLACVKGKNVLRKEPMSKDIAETDLFLFNDKFTSKFVKVKIGTVAAQKEAEPERQETRMKVEEDRKPQIEAAIVRIMKSRRLLDHNGIVSEVTKQLASRFMPNPGMIRSLPCRDRFYFQDA
eukprot:scaffold3020_cov342-Prasinococcus_capsulatus_cf.AAC.9